jgi:hypothetical protein
MQRRIRTDSREDHVLCSCRKVERLRQSIWTVDEVRLRAGKWVWLHFNLWLSKHLNSFWVSGKLFLLRRAEEKNVFDLIRHACLKCCVVFHVVGVEIFRWCSGRAESFGVFNLINSCDPNNPIRPFNTACLIALVCKFHTFVVASLIN